MSHDADAGRAFYSALFGWSWEVSGPETGHYGVAHVAGARTAGLGAIPPGDPTPTAWTVYFGVDDADATAAAIVAHGGVVLVPPMDIANEGRMAIAQDPTGAVFGLWQPGDHKGANLVHEPGGMSWCEVNTRGADAACDFYSKVFGLEVRRLDAPIPTDYFTLRNHEADAPVAGILQMTDAWGDLPPHWMLYFSVNDADDAAQRAVELGGTCLHGPFDTAYGRMAVLQDPQGAVFSIQQNRVA
jgi:predicted enzyme related to lactoylglutathione lyase